jgi:hypothetical protein
VVGILGGQLRVSKGAEPPQPVIEADHHDSLARQRRPGISRRRRAAVDEPAPVYPHQYGQLLRRACGPPDIGVEAVFGRSCAKWRRIAGKRQLHAIGRIVRCIPNPCPSGSRLRGTPAQRADRRCSEWDALERDDTGFGRAPQRARLHTNLRGNLRQRWTDHQADRRTSESDAREERHATIPIAPIAPVRAGDWHDCAASSNAAMVVDRCVQLLCARVVRSSPWAPHIGIHCGCGEALILVALTTKER